jgi:Putative esterase
VDLPGPQSTLFFLLLMVVFGALIWWLVVTRQMVFRVLAACLAFVPAMLFGVAAVNKYYDYYQNWNAAISDFTSQGVQAAEPPTARPVTAAGLSTFLGDTIDRPLARQIGFTLHLMVRGQLSHLDRSVYVYLPAQYFSPAYRHYRFPVIELLQGFPGLPQDWITVMDITAIMNELIQEHRGKPAVLVMPDTEGGRGISLQCLNQAHGPQDATYLARDLPSYIERVLRVQPPGLTWGIAGYSEGGYCAANLGLQYGRTWGYDGVLSGYFTPGWNQLGNPPRPVGPFGGNHLLLLRNTPDYLIRHLPVVSSIPQFWIGAGAADSADVSAANIFYQSLLVRQPLATLKFVPGGGHTAKTWRALLPGMMQWMTTNLAGEIVHLEARARMLARERCQKPAAGQKPSPPPHGPKSGTSPKAGSSPKAGASPSPTPSPPPCPKPTPHPGKTASPSPSSKTSPKTGTHKVKKAAGHARK